MKRSWMWLFLFSSCTYTAAPLAQGLSIKKQRQKLSFLEKKLHETSKEQRKLQEEVERLNGEIDSARLALIRSSVEKYEEQKEKKPPPFLEEREMLYHMIQEGPNAYSLEAQNELDRILRLITERSEGETERFH